ncbi:alpha/beta hydrolase [bacterium]|nr:alpha/beta hydrolase [candidate division CSSED10-310 bacterium]
MNTDETGIRLHFESRGTGPGLLLIHGFGGSIASWRHLMPALGLMRHTVAVDLLGHGDSPKPETAEYTAAHQATLVLNLCDHLTMDRFVICGHSYGGTVALHLAWDILCGDHTKACAGAPSPEKERLQGLIIVSGAAYPQDLPWHLKGMRSPYSVRLNEVVSPEAQMRLVLMNLFHNPLNITRQIISDYAWPMRSPGYHKALHETVKNIVPEDPERLVERYREIKTPALLIWGEKDTVVPPDIGEKLHLDLVNSTFHVIPDCGHMPMHEKPVELLNLIIDWLENLPEE